MFTSQTKILQYMRSILVQCLTAVDANTTTEAPQPGCAHPAPQQPAMAVRCHLPCLIQRPASNPASCAALPVRHTPTAAGLQRRQLTHIALACQETVEALKARVSELEGQLLIAKKVEEVSDAMSRLEGMAMQSASTGAKGQAEVSESHRRRDEPSFADCAFASLASADGSLSLSAPFSPSIN